MGSARVQYELERTLPALQLAARHGLFSPDVELRSITQRRREFENSLVRRHALVHDFVRYIHFEEELERLRVMRVTRLKDANEIPRQDMIKMQREAISHIISIFERGVKRIKFDLDLWKHYIDWAHRRKMRVVVSRVSARALALFPNNVQLWLLVADHELNEYQSASTARALLQRGLRLNSISHPSSLQAQAEQRPAKKMRRGKNLDETPPKVLSIAPADNAEDDRATLTLPEQEQELVRIWIEYIRMELVYLERLRRRRSVLGISQDVQDGGAAEEAEETTDAADVEEVPVNNDGEEAPPSLKSMREDAQEEQVPSDSLLMGAIPKSALRSAVSLLSPTSLPPRAHFTFLLALAHLVRGFPFYSDTEGLRVGLLRDVCSAVEDRFPTDSSAMLYVCAASFLDNAQQSKLAPLSEIELSEELQEGKLLRKASKLSLPSQSEVRKIVSRVQDLARSADEEDQTQLAFLYLIQQVEENLAGVRQTAQLAGYMKAIIDALRQRTLQLDRPSDRHLAAQLRLIRALEGIVEERNLDTVLAQYLAGCSKRVIHDAKKLLCNGVHMERERWRTRLLDIAEGKSKAETGERLGKWLGQLWQACESYGTDEPLLILYAKMVLLAVDFGTLDRGEATKRWARIQDHSAGRASFRVWTLWAGWVTKSDDMAWKVAQLESSLSRTMGTPSIHALLLNTYLLSSTSCEQWTARADHIERKTYPPPSLWREAINQVGGSNTHLSHAEKEALLTRFYAKLIQSGEEVEDHEAYLRFLMVERHDPVTGVQAFRHSLRRMANDVSKKIALEQAWDGIHRELRTAEEATSEAEEEEAAGGL